MKKHVCYLCGGTEYGERRGKVRDQQHLKIYECRTCGLVFLSSFDHITETFYAESQMHSEDVSPEEILKRTYNDDLRRFNMLKHLINDKDIMDFGCGYGGFLLNAKPTARSVSGIELEEKAAQFCKSKSIKITNINGGGTFDYITMFHVIEHLINPIEVLEQLKSLLKVNGKIVIETPNANDALLNLYESKDFQEFTYWGCHVYLYNMNTLVELAHKAGYKVKKIQQIQRYPISNHLFWLAKGKPGGDKVWAQFNDQELNNSYNKILESMGMCDTLVMVLELE